MSKIAAIHEIDDGVMSDDEIAAKVGCHAAYVRSVRVKSKRRAALAHHKLLRQRLAPVPSVQKSSCNG